MLESSGSWLGSREETTYSKLHGVMVWLGFLSGATVS